MSRMPQRRVKRYRFPWKGRFVGDRWRVSAPFAKKIGGSQKGAKKYG